MKVHILLAASLLAASATACGSGSGGSSGRAATAHGPIKIWYSNNTQEVAWGKQMVAAWNKANPSE